MVQIKKTAIEEKIFLLFVVVLLLILCVPYAYSANIYYYDEWPGLYGSDSDAIVWGGWSWC